MNILILGNCTENFSNYIKESKHFNKLFLTANSTEVNIPSFVFTDEKDLAHKIKGLQIDVVIISDKNYIQNGMVEYLRSQYINVISPNKKWFNLESSRLIAKQLLNHYSINIPQTIRAPKNFPLVIRTDRPIKDKIVKSMDELVFVMENFSGENFFLEEYLEGECYEQFSLWDGKSACHFINKDSLSEVQIDRLDLLQTKFNFMLSDEKADFIGFFSTKLIWAKNDWHVLDFSMSFNEDLALEYIKSDFLYILDSAIYQKLNEL